MEDQIIAVGGDHEESSIMNMEENVDIIVARAEKQVEALRKVLKIAVSRTNSSDWLNQQGKPYLGASGCEKIMPVFGVCFKDLKYEKKVDSDDGGIYYIYIYTSTAYWGGGSIVALGNCSSRDKFFAWDSSAQTYKPLSIVDECSVMKAAYSNMTMNGTTRLLGIRNLKWEQLAEFNIFPEKSARVDYAKGGAGGGLISEAQRKRLFAIYTKAGKTDDEVKSYILETHGYKSSKEIEKTKYEEVCNWVETKSPDFGSEK